MLLLLLACDTAGKNDPANDSSSTTVGGEAECDPTAQPPRQLRLLSRAEYNATVADLFGLGAVATACSEDADCDISSQSCENSVCADDPCTTVTFLYSGSGYSTVHVAGTFNGWAGTIAAGGWPMSWDDAAGAWVLKADLETGDYQYKFVLNESTWVEDPNNSDTTDDGYGGRNSLLSVSCSGETTGTTTYDFTAAFPEESRPDDFAYDNNAAAGLVTSTHMDAYLNAAEAVAAVALANPEGWLSCDPDDSACLDTFFSAVAPRIFRRPLTEAQESRYRALAANESAPAAALELALVGMLSSPYFLYRFEVGADTGAGSARLTGYEIASALSYYVWGTMPDQELFDAAAAGDLEDAAGIDAQVRRLLADPRARDRAETFARQWLGVESVVEMDKSTTYYPDFSTSLREAMYAESGSFFSHVVFDSSATLAELLTADYTVGDATLAAHYGATAPAESWGEISLPAERHAGILSQGAVLTVLAHSDQTAPIQRGLWVRERLLCQTFGTPPAEAASVPEVDPNATTRERFAQHTADPFCASCHQYIDPVGFGFEHFDAVGAWRDTENGLAIDSSGDMNDVEGIGTGTSAPYTSLPELGGILSASEAAHQCMTQQVYRYALGWLEEETPCSVRDMGADFLGAGGNIQELMVEIATSNDFVMREVE